MTVYLSTWHIPRYGRWLSSASPSEKYASLESDDDAVQAKRDARSVALEGMRCRELTVW